MIDNKRKKRVRTKYGQAPLEHAKKGVNSCLLLCAVVFLIFLMLLTSYYLKGEITVWVGVAAIGAIGLAVMGIMAGIRGFRERNKNYIMCKIGIVGNAAMLLAFLALYIRGLM